MDGKSKKFYWFHSDVCLNITYSDNPPLSSKRFVEDTVTDLGNAIKHTLDFEGHKRNIIVPKTEKNDTKYIKTIHNAIHKFLADRKKESDGYVQKNKYLYCTNKQHEKIRANK